MNEISVEELAQWRRDGRHFVLLDVREPFELERARLDGVVHVPMRELPAKVQTFDPDVPVAVLCHHGHRSAYAAQFLQATGFHNVYNVAGGIDAYAKRVDPRVGTY